MNRFMRALPAMAFCLLAYGAGAQTPPPAVVVQPVEVKEVAPKTDFIGRVEALKAVDIRARVEGVLQQRAFEEGQLVHKGDLLYVIDPATYQAAVAHAQAAVTGAQANLTNLESALERQKQLRASQAAAEATLQQAQANRDAAEATLQQAQADLRTAQINLGYTRITSPIDGRIGSSALSVGNLVNPSSGALARVVQVDPIRVVFSVSDETLLQIRNGAEQEPLEALYPRFTPTLRLATGQEYPGKGAVDFIGNEVDPQTLTIPVWAQFDNKDGVLIPGQYVTVSVRRTEAPTKPVVPLGAVQQDREGRYVLLLGKDNKVEVRRIEGKTQIGQDLAVDKGLSGGEQIIVQGFQNARPGQVVQPHPASTETAQQTQQ